MWSPHDPRVEKSLVNTTENFKRRFTKWIFQKIGIRNTDYSSRLQAPNLISPERRRFNFDLAMVYAMFSGEVELPTSEFFTVAKTIGCLRSHHVCKLAVRRSSTNAHEYFFSNIIVNAWNRLPKKIVHTPGLKIFKRRLLSVTPEELGHLSLIND